MPTTELSIADLAAAARDLLPLPQEIMDVATEQITRISDTYNAILANQSVTIFVNQATGSDSNSGVEALPLATIGRALELTPRGGVCTVKLQADYTVDATFIVAQKTLVVASASVTRHRFQFIEFLNENYSPALRDMHQIGADAPAQIIFSGVTVCYPSEVVGLSAYGKTGRAMLNGVNAQARLNLSIIFCDVDIPASPAFVLFPLTLTADLYWYGVTLTGATTDYKGLIHGAHTNAAGTDPLTSHNMQSNIALI